MSAPVRILLADDHAVLRAGLRALLDAEPDLEVVGEAATGEEAIEKTRELNPTSSSWTSRCPASAGSRPHARSRQLEQKTRVLVLTMHAEEEFLLPVLEAGGNGYVRKTRADEDLTQAIRTVARDEVFLYPNATKILLQGYKAVEAGRRRARSIGSANGSETSSP